MIITLPWLKQHLASKADENKLINQLTNIGLEVENISEGSGELSEFKIAKIIKAKKHPNADKLKVCDVNVGNNRIVKVVCGAPNARDGLVTIYAPPGATIPKTKFKLKIAKIRGVESSGMLCSESELNLSNESDGIIELKNNENEIGKSYFKNNGEKSIDISITPNRPDCLGVRGIARDLAASGLGKLKKLKKISFKQNFKQPIKISITKEKNQGCLAFGSCYIKNIKNQESPTWLKEKILALGLKPISAVVDITNYVMFDLNRPLHAYDANKIKNEIIVRAAKNNESFEALDGKKYNLQSEMCVIADQKGVLGLGGIIGGSTTSTEFNTKNILLESAYFLPSSIRKTARILNVNTDAKFRFERGIDPNSIKEGLEVATNLILKICGGEESKFLITGSIVEKNKNITFDIEKFRKLIGISISIQEASKILTSLGCSVKKNKQKLLITIPSWRPDILNDEDVIEELIHLSKRSVSSKGYVETVTWSFTNSKIDKQLTPTEKKIEIFNPISSDLDVLRRSIFSNLLINLKKNQDRGYDDLSLFEVGPIFFGKNPGEQQVVIGGLKSGYVGKKSWLEKSRKIDVFDVKADVIKTLVELGLDEEDLIICNNTKDCYHPGRSGSINLKSDKGPHLAYFGEIHPSIILNLDFKEKNIYGFEIFLKNISQPNKKVRISKKNFVTSDFQKSERDFAFVIDKSFTAGKLEKIIKKIDDQIIQTVTIFDVFEETNVSEEKKSVAVNVIIQSKEKTLTENDLDQISQKIINTVKDQTGATIRS